MSKSPFIIVENFLSPQECRGVVAEYGVEPKSGLGYPTVLGYIPKSEPLIANRVSRIVPQIEDRFGVAYKGLHRPELEQYGQSITELLARKPGCENSAWLKDKRVWIETKPNIDLVGYIFLSAFNDKPAFDSTEDVYGGITEFAVYDFGICPQIGTLILYPAGANFISHLTAVRVGTLRQIKITISVESKLGTKWIYNPSSFTGNYSQWFGDKVG